MRLLCWLECEFYQFLEDSKVKVGRGGRIGMANAFEKGFPLLTMGAGSETAACENED